MVGKSLEALGSPLPRLMDLKVLMYGNIHKRLALSSEAERSPAGGQTYAVWPLQTLASCFSSASASLCFLASS